MRRSAWFLATLLLLSTTTPLEVLARGGGGGGGGGGGWGGGSHAMFGDGARPNGGNADRSNFTGNNFNNDTFNRTVNVNQTNGFYNRDANGWNNNWRHGGYWNNRPWNAGWYGGWGGWGWWGGSAAAWGIAGLATSAAITSLVNQAADASSPVIVVPSTSFELNYGSVDAVGNYGASFFYTVNGTELLGAANCLQGLLNGQVPTNADQAQLLNAVCQVAYGAGG